MSTTRVIFRFTRGCDDEPSSVAANVTPGHPGCFGGPPDAWCQPDPAEVEILGGTLADGTNLSADDYTSSMSEEELRGLEEEALEAFDSLSDRGDEPEDYEDDFDDP